MTAPNALSSRDPYFTVLRTDHDGETTVNLVTSAPATAGPWATTLQHGGPPNALAVACAERVVRERLDRSDLVPLRLASEFVGPVPVGELEVRTRVVRAARSAVLAEVVIAAGGRDCLHTRVWSVRDADTAGVAAPLPEPVVVPEGASGLDAEFPYGASLEWRFVRGSMRQLGPGATWARPATPLLAGHRWTGLSHAALVADSASGVSAELDWDEWSFLNVDLDIHLARPMIGDWLLMEATTQLGAHGSALARSTLSDVHGALGAGLQTLVLAPRRR